MRRFLKFFALAFIFALSFGAEAQSIPSQIPEIQEQISVTVEPKIPAPFQNVKITLEAYGTNLDQANITWTINGTLTKSGKGEIILELQAPKAGSRKTVVVSIKWCNCCHFIYVPCV